MKKKWLSLLSVTVVISMFASACGSSSSSNSAADNKKTDAPAATAAKSTDQKAEISIVWWGNQDRADKTLAAIKIFEQKNPNIKVNATFSGWPGYFDKLSAQVNGGNAPDVIQMDISQIKEYAKRGALMDLTGKVNLSDYDQNVLQAGVIDKKLYGIVTGVAAEGLLYNPSILDKAGIKLDPSKRLTYDEFAQMATQVAQKVPGVYGSVDGMFNNDYPFYFYVREAGQNQYTEDGKLGFDKKTLVDWFTYWDKLRKSKGATPGDITAAYKDTASNPFAQGRAAFFFAHIGDPTVFDMEKMLGVKIGFTNYPALDGPAEGTYLRPAMYWSAYSKSKYPEATAKLIDFLINDVDGAKILQDIRSVPIPKKVKETVKPMLDENQKRVWDYIDSVAPIAKPISPIAPNGSNEVLNEYSNVVQQIQFGKLTPEQGADEFMQKANDILSKNKQ